MNYYSHLYVGESIEKKEKNILRRLRAGRPTPGIFLIVLAHNLQNHLEVFDSALLLQNIFQKEEQFLIGIASGQEEAFLVVEQITAEVYTKTDGADIRGYLTGQKNK